MCPGLGDSVNQIGTATYIVHIATPESGIFELDDKSLTDKEITDAPSAEEDFRQPAVADLSRYGMFRTIAGPNASVSHNGRRCQTAIAAANFALVGPWSGTADLVRSRYSQ